MKSKKIYLLTLVTIFLSILVVSATYAFWVWKSSQNTNVSFSVTGKDFSCSADGGGNITSADIKLAPASCTDSSRAIVREIHTNVHNGSSGKINLNLYLNVNSIDTELASTSNFKYALTDSNSGCTSGNVISKGNFNGKVAGYQINLLSSSYGNNLSPDPYSDGPYYLYIWLDEVETNASTAGKSFNMSLSGDCSDGNIPNRPDVVDGLIPVKLSDNGATVTTVAEDDPTWYDYYDKKWANAILVSNSSRSNYEGTSGVNVTLSDILAYYVWIPRYSYRVWQYSGISSVGSEQTIDIKFIGTDIIEDATQNGDWYTHPAFWWDNNSNDIREEGEELSGIWVGKFELSHATLSTSTTNNNLGCTASSCSNYTGLRILPNIKPLEYNNIGNFFFASQAMTSESASFGLNSTADSHVMKDRDWAAVAYLSHSQYGINTEVGRNGQKTYTTGCGITTPTSEWESNCTNAYGTITNYLQSTTGNVTGVFDMSGGDKEILMGLIYTSSHLNYLVSNDTGFSSAPAFKYVDRYTPLGTITACTFAVCGGHAVTETYNWYNDEREFPGDPLHWIIRSGYLNSSLRSGLFTFERGQAKPGAGRATRLVLIKEP